LFESILSLNYLLLQRKETAYYIISAEEKTVGIGKGGCRSKLFDVRFGVPNFCIQYAFVANAARK
jgi:hypothetical protein